MNIALANNQLIKVHKEQLEEAIGRKREAFGAFLPSLSLRASYTRFSDVSSLDMVSPIFHEGPISFTDLYGQTFTGFVAEDFTDSEYEMGQEDNYLAQATITQSLFTWGKIRRRYKQTRLNYSLMEEEYNRVRNEVVFEVKKAFHGLLLARELLTIAQEGVDFSQRHYEVTEDFYREGKLSSLDVSRAKVRLINAKIERIKAKNNLKLAKKSLFNLINYVYDDEKQIVGELKYYAREIDLDKSIEMALRNRPEIKATGIKKEIAHYGVKLARAENRPNLSAVANYEYKKPYYFEDEWDDSWNAGVVLNFPLFNGLSNFGRIKQAKSQMAQLEILQDRVIKGIKLEVERAYLVCQEARERIEAQRENLKQAADNLGIMEERYERGLVSDLELKDTQLTYTQVKTNYSQAIFDYTIALAELELATGAN